MNRAFNTRTRIILAGNNAGMILRSLNYECEGKNEAKEKKENKKVALSSSRPSNAMKEQMNPSECTIPG
jgi:hypothetical protein